jgi:hypothetical protein
VPLHHRMRVIDRDLIRGGHYGQRSCERIGPQTMVSEELEMPYAYDHIYLIKFPKIVSGKRQGNIQNRPLGQGYSTIRHTRKTSHGDP